MEIILARPRPEALTALSALCQRSKAHWGYDAVFMAAVRDALTLRERDLSESSVIAAHAEGTLLGTAQLMDAGDGTARLDKLFVDPPFMGQGVGRRLFDWCIAEARGLGARAVLIEADHEAVPFYRRMGAQGVGYAPSGSIPGRRLPLMRAEVGPPPSRG